MSCFRFKTIILMYMLEHKKSSKEQLFYVCQDSSPAKSALMERWLSKLYVEKLHFGLPQTEIPDTSELVNHINNNII